MTNKGTRQSIYYRYRKEAAAWDSSFDCRADMKHVLGISESRLYKIESGLYVPHRDELIVMSEKYRAPKLLCFYCQEQCEVGERIEDLLNRGILKPKDVYGWMPDFEKGDAIGKPKP